MNDHDSDSYILSRCRRLKAVIADVAAVNHAGRTLGVDRMSMFLVDLLDGILAIEETVGNEAEEQPPWNPLPDPPDAGRNHHPFPEVDE